MNKLVLVLKTIRLPNLLMLALVQYMVCAYFLQVFTWSFYFNVSLATILIALGGYLLNDVKDIDIDLANNKLKWVKRENIALAYKVSALVICSGLLLGFIVSWQSSLELFLFFALAASGLVIYAFVLSKYKIFGNLLISGLIALSILLCFYLGIEHPEFTRKYFNMNEIGVWVYAGIAFLLNWIRELVKDLEDIGGDKVGGRKSLPILVGVNLTKFIVSIVLIFFIGIFAYLSIRAGNNIDFRIYIFCIILISFASLVQLTISKNQKQFNTTSTLLKILMFIGVMLPISDFI